MKVNRAFRGLAPCQLASAWLMVGSWSG
jgi:hypothetical protein